MTTTPDQPMVFDHTDAEFSADAYTNVAELRAVCPVIHSPRHGGFFAVTSHADVADAANDYQRFTPTGGITLPKVQLPVRSLPLEADPPEHGIYRRILQPFFTLRRVGDMEDRVRPVVVDHIESFREAGHAELVQQLANPVPAIVIAMLLGLPPANWAELKDVTTRTQLAAVAGDRAMARQAATELGTILRRECDDRRRAPKDDIISAVVHAQIDGMPIDPDIAFAIVQIVVVAGFDTTVYGIGTLLRLMAADAELQALVRAGDSKLRSRVIEESLRIDSPVFGLARSAVIDTELSGCPIPEGARLLLCYGAANHDSDVFESPEDFNPERENVGKHLAFGFGRHRCIGEHLAKMEIRIVLDELLDRIPPFTLEQSGEILMRYSMTRGPVRLPVVW
jgi:cytochrome P450